MNYYYDWAGDISSDGESGLCQLCERCAGELGDAVGFASDGTEPGSLCERCEGAEGPPEEWMTFLNEWWEFLCINGGIQ